MTLGGASRSAWIEVLLIPRHPSRLDLTVGVVFEAEPLADLSKSLSI